MSEPVKPPSPAQLSGYQRLREAKKAKADRVDAERLAERDRVQASKDATNADRIARGLPPHDYDAPRTNWDHLHAPAARPATYGPVLPGSRLVDGESLGSLGLGAAATAVYLECARFFFCKGWTEGVDYSVSADGLHIRPDLWSVIGERVAVHEKASAARLALAGRPPKVKPVKPEKPH